MAVFTHDNLEDETVRFVLGDPSMSNRQIAKSLNIKQGEGNHLDHPTFCFYTGNGSIVGFRQNLKEIAILHGFQSTIKLAEKIGVKTQQD